jgi:hypothetical protein
VAKSSTRKWRIAAIIAGCLVAVILIGIIFINNYLTPILSAKLKSTVFKASRGLYSISFRKAELHVLRGNAVLYDALLMPDSNVYRQMEQKGIAPAEIYTLKVKQLVISDAHPFKLYFHKQLDIGLINLDNPELLVSKFSADAPDTVKTPDSTLYQKLSKSLRMIHVGGIKLNGIRLTYADRTGPKPQVLVLKEMNLQAMELLIDSATQTDKTRSLFCKDIITDLHHFKWVTADGLYQFKVSSIRFSVQNSRLTVDSAEMMPVAATTFFAHNPHKWDRYTVRFGQMVANNFDFQSFRKKQELNIGRLEFKKGLFEIYNDPNGVPKKTDRVVTYPNWVLRDLTTRLDIDTLDVSGIDVIYRAYNKPAHEAGSVLFGNTTGRFLNITNKQALIQQHNKISAKLTSYLVGKAKLYLDCSFNLRGNYNFSYSGHLGPTNLQVGNSTVMPLGLVKFESGEVKSLDFAINATKRTFTGKVNFLYNDLKISLLNHGQNSGYTKKPIKTLFANLVVLRSDNPDKTGAPPRSAAVTYVRPPEVAFFGSIWAALYSGIKPCAGVGKAEPPATDTTLTKKQQRQKARAMKKAGKKAKKAEKQIKKQQQDAEKKG